MDKAFIDAASDAIGRAIAGMQREASQAEQVRVAEYRAKMAEADAFFVRLEAEVERRVESRLETVRDGQDGAPGREGPPGERGQDGANGKDGADGVAGRDGQPGLPGRDGASGINGNDGAPGERGEKGDAGANGKDARGFVSRGTYDPVATYEAGDFVMHNGSSWLAKQDNPGPLEVGDKIGDGWTMLAGRGRRGERGKDGDRGAEGRQGLPGRDAPAIVAAAANIENWAIDLILSDGAVVQCDMHPLLQRFAKEISP